ncbi:hypothetical protein [Rhodococcus gannanensis]|uniref:Uncharacterized protein n=1 Tax=Rhodococcus gannanensis TaxID=1960308 RepID=A0ABW4P1E6_9NOCA
MDINHFHKIIDNAFQIPGGFGPQAPLPPLPPQPQPQEPAPLFGS